MIIFLSIVTLFILIEIIYSNFKTRDLSTSERLKVFIKSIVIAVIIIVLTLLYCIILQP